jgi:hypothetical protein
VKTLESVPIVILRLSPVPDNGITDEPVVSTLNFTGQVSLLVKLTNILPENSMNLVGTRSCSNYHGFVRRMRSHPPSRDHSSGERLADTVTRLYGYVLVILQGVNDITLLTPQLNPECLLDPIYRVKGVDLILNKPGGILRIE